MKSTFLRSNLSLPCFSLSLYFLFHLMWIRRNTPHPQH